MKDYIDTICEDIQLYQVHKNRLKDLIINRLNFMSPMEIKIHLLENGLNYLETNEEFLEKRKAQSFMEEI